jgi:hypothetical protein
LIVLVGVAIQPIDGGNIRLLSLRSRAARPGCIGRCQSRRQRGGRAKAAERVAPPAHRDAPVSHHAARIALEHGVEGLDRRGKPEGVKLRHTAIEISLYRRRARGGEVHLAQPPGGGAVIVILSHRLSCEHAHAQARRETGDHKRVFRHSSLSADLTTAEGAFQRIGGG